ncbi:predicted protein [Sclerotinia sclerotiorum 1980 UF-70]|uniref:Uncharacterized protein n=1 Tax=Sclerotinia sclerotiorum (strain ATCC 18683 / 1980 / Ss-1) TaxID=665079 RepID=A7F5X6_SCLS1|nr:predicted protein [Sclerotinia sclerotiorum 1980 UF-70]EDN98147.1 predicted protein [Sclerotinia sclerotiorum 1980 UF-70]
MSAISTPSSKAHVNSLASALHYLAQKTAFFNYDTEFPKKLHTCANTIYSLHFSQVPASRIYISVLSLIFVTVRMLWAQYVQEIDDR